MKSIVKKVSLASMIVAGFAACGKSSKSDSNTSDGFTGLYAVTTQTTNEENCDQEGPADTTAPAFYRIFPNSDVFPGTPGWSTESCSTIETCKDDTIDLGNLSFDTQAGNTWTGESMTTASGGVNCSVAITNSTAIKQADGTLAIESKTFSGMLELTGDDCDPDSAKIQEQRASLTCSRLTKVVTAAAQ